MEDFQLFVAKEEDKKVISYIVEQLIQKIVFDMLKDEIEFEIRKSGLSDNIKKLILEEIKEVMKWTKILML